MIPSCKWCFSASASTGLSYFFLLTSSLRRSGRTYTVQPVVHFWLISWHKRCNVFRCKWAPSRSIWILDVLCIMAQQRRFKDFESKFKEVGRQVSFRRFMKNLRFSSWGWRIPTWSQQMFQGELFHLIKHSLWWLLSDPSPIIGNACHSLHWLTD